MHLVFTMQKKPVTLFGLMLSSENVSRCLIRRGQTGLISWGLQSLNDFQGCLWVNRKYECFIQFFSYSCLIICIKLWYLCIHVFQLQQKTIKSLLNSTSCTEVRFWTSSVKVSVISVFNSQLIVCFFVWQGYSVENVLGSEIGPLSVFVHVVNRSHTVWMGLEECDLHWQHTYLFISWFKKNN